jgi:translation initiation factor IF-1
MASLTHKKKHIKKKKTNDFILKIENENQEYGQIIGPKGNTRFEVKLIKNNEIFNVKLRGTLSKGPNKQRIEKKDIVLLHPDNSTTDNDKYFIIHKYSNDDIKRLQKMGELAQINLDDNDPIIMYEDDILQKKIDEIKIDDNFIDNI